MIVIERLNIRLEWIEPGSILKKTCAGFVSTEALREVYEAALAPFSRRGAVSVLSDNRLQVPVPRAVLDWIRTDWAPRMVHAGWRHWAVIEPASPLGAMSARRWMEIYRRLGVQVEVFRSEADALEWLRSQPVELRLPPMRAGQR